MPLSLTVDVTVALRPAHSKYISAFANSSGGTLYFGIHDDGFVLGVGLPEAQVGTTKALIEDMLR